MMVWIKSHLILSPWKTKQKRKNKPRFTLALLCTTWHLKSRKTDHLKIRFETFIEVFIGKMTGCLGFNGHLFRTGEYKSITLLIIETYYRNKGFTIFFLLVVQFCSLKCQNGYYILRSHKLSHLPKEKT